MKFIIPNTNGSATIPSSALMHDLPLAMTYADEIWVMRDGRIAACGTPMEICESGILRELFGVAVVCENGEFFYKLNQ